VKHEQQIKILVFAKEHDYIVTPMGWAKHLQAISQHGHCPCDSDRPECPCTLAIGEIAETGHCKCSLLWRSYDTYLALRDQFRFEATRIAGRSSVRSAARFTLHWFSYLYFVLLR
jgi:ferredoxin-thioredoxin reductase catalytic subunit